MQNKEQSKEASKQHNTKELEVIQDIIKRMANNSFLLKGWTVTLVTVALLFKANKPDIYLLIALIPLIAFWYLDAYFLRQERLYRNLYNWVVDNRLTTDEYLFNMNAQGRFKDEVSCIATMFSKTLLLFYLTILILVVLFICIKQN